MQTIESWERKVGFQIVDLRGRSPDEKVSEDDFKALMARDGDQFGNARGVAYDIRSQWLKDNGYEVTRENLLNADLPPKAV